MSEIKVETANTAAETTTVKEPWYKRLWHNRKVRTGLKIVGGVAGAGAAGAVGYLIGRNGCAEPDDDDGDSETEAI